MPLSIESTISAIGEFNASPLINSADSAPPSQRIAKLASLRSREIRFGRVRSADSLCTSKGHSFRVLGKLADEIIYLFLSLEQVTLNVRPVNLGKVARATFTRGQIFVLITTWGK